VIRIFIDWACVARSSPSLALFNVFINKVIIDLKVHELGCFINKTWVGCVLYADDIILLLLSVY
jgi:hypothetical protein